MAELVVVLWEWVEGAHKGGRFWACHQVEGDAHVRDWPVLGLRARGAARVAVVEGEGLDLLPAGATAPDEAPG